MPFDYVTNLDAVINALKDFNTTTASPDLSGGLSKRINNDDILKSDPEKFQPRSDRLPTIYVLINNKEEDAASLGETGITGAMKEANVIYNVIGIIGKYGGYSPHSDLLDDAYKLAKNIEGVFQAEMDLSGTALWVNPAITEFQHGIPLGEEFAKAVLVTLRARYLFR